MSADASVADILAALRFAAERHRVQARKDGETPYVNHLIDVVELLARVGRVRERDVLLAAILHDTVEDTGTKPEELAADFGARVAEIVVEVSDDKSLAKEVRKQKQIDHAHSLSREAKLVKLADKISNVVDVVERPAHDWSLERRTQYFDWALAVVNEMRGTNDWLEKAFDEIYALARSRVG